MQVHGEDAFPIVFLHVLELIVRDESRRAGVIDQNIQAAELAHGGVDYLAASGIVGHVGFDGQTAYAQGRDVGGRLLGFVPRS